jgi:hypothetical protein
MSNAFFLSKPKPGKNFVKAENNIRVPLAKTSPGTEMLAASKQQQISL